MNSVTIRHVGDHMTAELHGELDMSSVPIVAAQVDCELRSFAPTRLAFDLDDVAFIDSSGLALLIEYRNLAARSNLNVTLRRVPPRAQRLLEITEMTGHFVTE